MFNDIILVKVDVDLQRVEVLITRPDGSGWLNFIAASYYVPKDHSAQERIAESVGEIVRSVLTEHVERIGTHRVAF